MEAEWLLIPDEMEMRTEREIDRSLRS